jgi:hypothetical protein
MMHQPARDTNMNVMRKLLPSLMIVLAAVPVTALADATPEELEAKRRLEQWRKHPEQLARLRYHAQLFQSLPEPRRQQLVQLDHDLHEEASTVQARLINIADRYAGWLEQLKNDPQRHADYQQIVAAPDKTARLTAIRAIREREWLRDQPQAVRDQIAKLDGKERADRIKQVKDEARQREREWLIAGRFWNELVNKKELPSKLTDFPPEVQVYINEYLWYMLSPEEKNRLEKAVGQWPRYPMTLVELADKHPPALPGLHGPRKFDELPREVQNKLAFIKKSLKFKIPEGKWPNFGTTVTKLAATSKRDVDFLNEFLPYRFEGLSTPMQTFVHNVLKPALEGDDRKFVTSPPTTWPTYPLMIQELSRKYHLNPPWFTLPGSPTRWEAYRLPKVQAVQGLPELPQQQLRDFVQFGLNDKERETLKWRPDDPTVWQRLHQAYFERHPQELRALRQRDQRKHRPAMSVDFAKEKVEKFE